MSFISRIDSDSPRGSSPLMFSDRFLRLAQEADRAGLRVAAEQLVYLAIQVLDDARTPRRAAEAWQRA